MPSSGAMTRPWTPRSAYSILSMRTNGNAGRTFTARVSTLLKISSMGRRNTFRITPMDGRGSRTPEQTYFHHEGNGRAVYVGSAGTKCNGKSVGGKVR